jgi:hypothetical protein
VKRSPEFSSDDKHNVVALRGDYQRYEYLGVCAWANHVEALVSERLAVQNLVQLRA